jgi:hypothetical protein
MKVKELIEILSHCNPEHEVVIQTKNASIWHYAYVTLDHAFTSFDWDHDRVLLNSKSDIYEIKNKISEVEVKK